jgi:peptide deformylase
MVESERATWRCRQTVRPIYMIPRDAAVLRARSVRYADVRQAAALVQDLRETWDTVAAHGIAAPQVGVNRRLFVYRPYEAGDEVEPIAVVNPKIIKASGELTDFDGCLSVPGVYGQTRRAERVEIMAETLQGERVRLKFEGFTARIIQHEIDHLEGVLFIDRLDGLDDLYVLEEEPPGEEGGEPKLKPAPLTPAQRQLIETQRRPLPGHALHW